MDYGQRQAAPGALARDRAPSVGAAVGELDAVMKRLAHSAEQLGMLVDRVAGPQPTEVPKPGNIDGVPAGIIAAVNMRRSALEEIASMIEGHIGRLEISL